MEQARRDGPVVVVDAGDAMAPPSPQHRGAAGMMADQRRAKGAFMLRGLVIGGIDAAALGEDDWALGTDAVRQAVAEVSLPVVAANLTCDGASPYPASREVVRGERRIAVVGVTEGRVAGCEVGDPVAALRAAVDGLGEVDAVVALVPTTRTRAREIAAAVPGLDLVVDADRGGPITAPLPAGEGWVVGTGGRGQRVGRTTLRFGPRPGFLASGGVEAVDAEILRAERRVASLERTLERRGAQAAVTARWERQLEDARGMVADLSATREAVAARAAEGGVGVLSTAIVELDDAVADHGPTAEALTAFLDAQTQAELGRAPVAPSATVARAVPSGPYAGADTCAGCHPGPTAQWASTPHAHAWATLQDEGRAGDAACFRCHVTGANAQGGPKRPRDVGGLRDVQCEACHGPSRAHVQDPLGSRPIRAPGRAFCIGCHDGEQDGGRFDFATYVPKVRHAAADADKPAGSPAAP